MMWNYTLQNWQVGMLSLQCHRTKRQIIDEKNREGAPILCSDCRWTLTHWSRLVNSCWTAENVAFFLLPEPLCDQAYNMLKMRLQPELCPGPHWGSSRRSPRHPSRLGRGIVTHSALDPRTFGARLSVTPTGFLTNRTLDRPHNSFQPRAPKNLNPALQRRNSGEWRYGRDQNRARSIKLRHTRGHHTDNRKVLTKVEEIISQ